MGWSVGWDYSTLRFRGYGVPSICEEPSCNKEINRGLAYACGNLYDGCGRFFCEDHLYLGTPGSIEDEDDADHREVEQYCSRCLDGDATPYPLKPERWEWLNHVVRHPSWRQWRDAHKDVAAEYRFQLKSLE